MGGSSGLELMDERRCVRGKKGVEIVLRLWRKAPHQ